MIATIPKLTDIGMSLLLRSISGEKITFTRFKVGDGWIAEGSDWRKMRDLINPLVTFDINEMDVLNSGSITLSGTFDSSDVTADFEWRELGVFCKGEDGAEMLYAYANSAEDAELLRALATDILTEQTVTLVIAVGEAANVTAIISPKEQYAQKADFEKHTDDQKNPHKVTKEQVGLGNVPNSAPQDSPVAFTEAESNETLNAGETIRVLIGKIARAVKLLYAHLNNKSNPHTVTLEHVGGAKAKHQHSANDINAGVLALERGGTGVDNLDALKSLIGTNAAMSVYSGDGTMKRLISLGFKPSAVLLFTGNGMTCDTTRGVCGGLALGAYGLRSLASTLPSHATTWDDQFTALLIADDGFYVNFYEGETVEERIATNADGETYLYIAYR